MPTKPKPKRRPWEQKPVEYNKQAGQGRRGKNQAFYQSRNWQRVRQVQLLQTPFCEECQKNGVTTPARVVDHIKPINPMDAYDTQGGRYPHPLSQSNLQSMCDRCHNVKSAKERHKK